jgi:hypothetical protein
MIISIANSGKSPLSPLFQRGELAVERAELPNTYRAKLYLPSCIIPPLKKGDKKGDLNFFTASGLLMGSLQIAFAMKRLMIFYLTFTAPLLSPCMVFAQSEKIPAEVIAQTANNNDAVPVLVGLNVPWQRESTLSENAISLQRQAIHSIQEQLVSELSGTKYGIVRRYDVIPAIALEVGAAALAVLEKSSSVTNVLPDKPAKSTANSPIDQTGDDKIKNLGSVPAELFAEVARNGAVLVLVGLKAPWSPEGSLNANLVSAQREAIAAAQNYLLTELADTKYRITRRYDKIPGIALEVGPDALNVLSRSVAVTNVLPDRPASATK